MGLLARARARAARGAGVHAAPGWPCSTVAGERLPLEVAPVLSRGWAGPGDGNSQRVTAAVTTEVMLSRWQAADLYLADLVHLVEGVVHDQL